MAAKKLYVVKTTVEYRDKKGEKLRLLRDNEPQEVPADLVKELEAKGAIVAAAGSVSAKSGKAQGNKNADTDNADSGADQDAGSDTDPDADGDADAGDGAA